MGANMRRLVVLCSAFAILVAPALAQTARRADGTAPVAIPAKQPAKKKGRAAKSGEAGPAEAGQPATKQRAGRKGGAPKGEAKKTAPDTRPILRRADDMAPIVTPAQPPAKKRARAARKPSDAVSPESDAPAAAGGRATPRDIVACGQVKLPDAAVEGCTKIIEDQKQKPKGRAIAYYNRGNARSAKGDHDGAIGDYDEAIKLDPKNASAFNNRGNAKNDKGESEAAIADFDAAVKANARYAAAYFSRANAYAASGDARAMQDYDAALKYDRRNVNAYLARGALLLAGGATAKARADMRRAAALERKNAYAILWQDIAERRAGQKGLLASGKAPKGLDPNAWPAPVLAMFGGARKADEVLAAADNPDATVKAAQTCEANFYSGEYALIDGNRDEAVKLFQAAVKDCPRGLLEGIAAAAELKGLEKAGN
jgi:lipoprotein NlpI